MCPIIRADMVIPIAFFVLFVVWFIAIPLLIVIRLDKILRILEGKDRK